MCLLGQHLFVDLEAEAQGLEGAAVVFGFDGPAVDKLGLAIQEGVVERQGDPACQLDGQCQVRRTVVSSGATGGAGSGS